MLDRSKAAKLLADHVFCNAAGQTGDIHVAVFSNTNTAIFARFLVKIFEALLLFWEVLIIGKAILRHPLHFSLDLIIMIRVLMLLILE
jgi:hypothetical protein